MRLATRLHEATIWKHLKQDWRLSGRPRPHYSPYGFHDEANDHRQSHAAAHRSNDDGCDFTCRGGTRRAATHRCLHTKEDGRVRWSEQALSLGGFQMRTDQRRAPSTTLQQIERKKWTRLQTSSDSAGSRLDPVWLPNHLAFDPQAFLFTHSQQRTIQTKDFSSVFPISASLLDLRGNNTVGVSWA